MKISIFGLGYVGVVTAACLAKEGHEIIGVDIADNKVEQLSSGQSPIIEKDIDIFVRQAVEYGRLKATKDVATAVDATEMGIVCVGTPSRPNGSLDNQYVVRVTEQIAGALRDRNSPFTLVFRSTMVPGTLRGLVIPTLERAIDRPLGNNYQVLFHPEFLREGTAAWDFYNPPKIVVGVSIPGAAKPLLSLYTDKFEAPRIVCDIEVAETVKYCDNLFHALKITFANEVGQFCYAHGINSQEVMQIFCQDTKLNISATYLMPGFAFGGSCLPKDIRAFLAVSGEQDLSLPLLENVLFSNHKQIERALRMILSYEIRKIGFYGISFKPGTDDLRESPYVELAERLIGKGRKVVIYDQNVQYSRLIGGNRSFIESRLPHLAALLSEKLSVLDECELLVLNHRVPSDQIEAWLAAGKKIFDLSGRDSFFGRANWQSIV